jgi:Skp family chaperone for outer membrane proteins
MAAAAALAVALSYLGSGLWAQQGTAPAARPASKIGVVNLPLVIKNYKKYQNYEKILEGMAKEYTTREEALKAQLMKDKENLTKATDKDAIEQHMKQLQRQLEDYNAQFKKDFSKKQEEQLVLLYKEVEYMVSQVAKMNGLELVFQYGDVIDKKDAYNPAIIQRKVLGGMCLPMYAVGGLDISEQVYKSLNNWYDNASKSTTGTTR